MQSQIINTNYQDNLTKICIEKQPQISNTNQPYQNGSDKLLDKNNKVEEDVNQAHGQHKQHAQNEKPEQHEGHKQHKQHKQNEQHEFPKESNQQGQESIENGQNIQQSIQMESIKFLNQSSILQKRNISYSDKNQNDPLRIVLIGLASAGKDYVAKILQCNYGLQVIKLNDNYQQTSKNISNLCFTQYQGKKVYIMQKPNYNTLRTLKKRNFVNVILVQASPLKRYRNSLFDRKIHHTQEQLINFLHKDDHMQDVEFQKCLEFVRVRIYNRQDFNFLLKQIQSKIQSIIKPFRPSWEQYFMKIADIARRRSNCMKSSVGAVIVNDEQRVVSTGYNGTAKGLTSCYKGGCERCNTNSNKSLDQCLCLHAEQSAIIQVGIGRTKGCDLYTTLYPCFSCAKIIKQAGIARIFYLDEYDKQDSGKAFLESNFDKKTSIIQIKIDNIYY